MSPQVLYNAAGVYCRMGQWEQAREVLLSTSQERGGGRGANVELALESIQVSVRKFHNSLENSQNNFEEAIRSQHELLLV